MYQRNDEGGIIDPPVIPEREREIYGVMQSDPGNSVKIERLTRQYQEEREALAKQEEADEREAQEDQAAKDADARDAVRARNAPQPSPDDHRNDPDPQTPEGPQNPSAGGGFTAFGTRP